VRWLSSTFDWFFGPELDTEFQSIGNRKLAEILRDKAKKIIFDLKGVTMLDSTGVGILVVCQGKITKEGGELRVAGATGIVEEVLKVTSVDKLFRLFSTVTEAATGF
jgi:anti-sigma B factor antagonist